MTWKITNKPRELSEGLFGQVILFIFEILPYLNEKSIYPVWDIKSPLYGDEPDYTVIPGVLEPNYTPENHFTPVKVSLILLRGAQPYCLGDNWHYLHNLFFSYFKIPHRILSAADQTHIPKNTLGVHYRGTDKNKAYWDTNPVSQEEMMLLIKDFLCNHSEIENLFIATDEYSFVEKAIKHLPNLTIINLGPVEFFKEKQPNNTDKADRAFVDCILLSRCGHVLKCASALSAFAKVLNPELIIYRIAACKMFTDIPYFPDAYIPKFSSQDLKCQKILEKLLENDWAHNPKYVKSFGRGFKTKLRYNHYQRLHGKLKFHLHLYAVNKLFNNLKPIFRF